MESGGRLVLRDLTLQNAVRTLGGAGGAVLVTESRLTMEDCEIIDNRGPSGAGLWIDDKSEVTLRRSLLARNEAYETSGGAAYVQGTLRLGDSRVEDNEAEGRGGGLYVTRDGELELVDSFVGASVTGRGNIAPWGGGMFVLGAALLQHSQVDGNAAFQYGGGVYLAGDEGHLTLQETAFVNNEGGTFGGALYITDNATLTSDSKSSIYDNRAGGSRGGGGVYVVDNDVVPARLTDALCNQLLIAGNTDGKDDENNLEPDDFCP